MKKLYIILSVGLAIFLIIQFPHVTINPGELALGHQKLNNECLSCHIPFGGIGSEKCIACHKLQDIGKNKRGETSKPQFHQQLSNQECNTCHTEHMGLIPEHAYVGFKHELLSSSIVNNCVACHTKPRDNLHSLIKDNCNKCHGTGKWLPATFDHTAYFVLDQKHNASCNTCHTNNNFSSFTCYGCHEHTESKIIDEHNEEGIYNLNNCVSCHRSGNELNQESKGLDDKERREIRDFIKRNDKDE